MRYRMTKCAMALPPSLATIPGARPSRSTHANGMTNNAMPSARAPHRPPNIRLHHERCRERAIDKIKPTTAVTGAVNQIVLETVSFISAKWPQTERPGTQDATITTPTLPPDSLQRKISLHHAAALVL